MLDLDIHRLGKCFVSHEAVDLFRIEVVDLAIQDCLPRSIKQSVQALTGDLQPEVLSVRAFWQVDQPRRHDQIASRQVLDPSSPLLP